MPGQERNRFGPSDCLDAIAADLDAGLTFVIAVPDLLAVAMPEIGVRRWDQRELRRVVSVHGASLHGHPTGVGHFMQLVRFQIAADVTGPDHAVARLLPLPALEYVPTTPGQRVQRDYELAASIGREQDGVRATDAVTPAARLKLELAQFHSPHLPGPCAAGAGPAAQALPQALVDSPAAPCHPCPIPRDQAHARRS